MDAEVDFVPEPVFRPVKRRRFARRRPDDNSEDSSTAEGPVGESNEHDRVASPSQSAQDGDQNAETTNVVRLRRAHPARKGGIGFSATSRSAKDGSRQTALGPVEDQEKEQVQAICDRFTGHTGQTVDVDKHMMTYIETEMAKRYQRSPFPENQEVARSTAQQTASGQPTPAQQLEREPASLGKLHEIDLGQETKLQNIARTEAATRRLVGDEDSSGFEESGTGTPSVHPVTNEKPSRHRKRRTSADVERDRLVEEVLRESKLDVYDEPEEETQQDDQAADDRIAEQFRREFLDAIQSRRRLAKTRNAKTDKAEAPKGPKLGGSRSARAAMRDTQTKPGQR